jgi:hypothetical protein
MEKSHKKNSQSLVFLEKMDLLLKNSEKMKSIIWMKRILIHPRRQNESIEIGVALILTIVSM